MGLVTWTAVFRLPSVRDAPADLARSVNGLVGAQLQRELRPKLRSRDWDFAEPCDPPSLEWTPMLAFRSWRGVSDEREASGLSGDLQTRSG